jgi:DnaJ-class molecular chaperone
MKTEQATCPYCDGTGFLDAQNTEVCDICGGDGVLPILDLEKILNFPAGDSIVEP